LHFNKYLIYVYASNFHPPATVIRTAIFDLEMLKVNLNSASMTELKHWLFI